MLKDREDEALSSFRGTTVLRNVKDLRGYAFGRPTG